MKKEEINLLSNLIENMGSTCKEIEEDLKEKDQAKLKKDKERLLGVQKQISEILNR